MRRFANALKIVLVVFVIGLCADLRSIPPETCTAQAGCPEPAVGGWQNYPDGLYWVFQFVGTNRWAGLDRTPVLPKMYAGYPAPSQPNTQPYVPCILLEAIGYTESTGWKQFNADYGGYGETVISSDCGYGIMQITSNMDGSDPGFSPSRVAGEDIYNIGTGAYFLIKKWNYYPNSVGNNNPYVVEDWYFAVWAYNSFSLANNPNNPTFDPGRSTWRCGQDPNQDRRYWPYQELIWGCAANPPSYQGTPFWQAVPLTLPPRYLFPYPYDAPIHIDDPQPTHGSCSMVFLPLILR